MGVPPSTSRRGTKKQNLMYKSKAKHGTLQVSSLSDGTYVITKIEAGKPKAGYQNPLVSVSGISERIYLHPTKLGGSCCKDNPDAPGEYIWRLPAKVEGMQLVVVNGTATISIPEAAAPPPPPTPVNDGWN